jgi:parallel beta-helix repeat protein
MKIGILVCVCAVAVAGLACTSRTGPRTIRVAQSGEADVIGSDNVALQKAADMLKPGDALEIGPGTYRMDNSLFIPSNVTVRGVAGQTILLKSSGVESALEEDGDYGESQLLVAESGKFQPGMGITVLDDQQNRGWDVSVTTVKAVEGKLLRIEPMTLKDYNLEQQRARIQNTFPILCVIEGENVVLEDITVDGNKDANAYIDGCRGGAIYMYRSNNVTVRNCVARNYNGDGISFQITDGIKVLNCESYGNTGLGIHPGTGSPNATVKGCHTHHNGQIGLFLCWRVRNGEFSDNLYFRKETFKNSGHRNTFRDNEIADNGSADKPYGFYVEPHAGDIVVENNSITETRARKGIAVYKVKGAGEIKLQNNKIEGFAAEYREGE